MASTDAGFFADLERVLRESGDAGAVLQDVLDQVIRRFGCVVGTIHRLDPESGMLTLSAQRGIPEVVLERVRVIPIGKGMAGLAAERLAPVQVCNLQTDESGVAKPTARETPVEGSIAAPMIVEGALRGVIGVAKPTAYEFSPAETESLLQAGSLIGRYL